MIEFRKVTKCYGKTVAIDALSLTLREKQIYCLLGCNGAGKTTLMNLIAGKISATSGEVSVDGLTVTTLAMPDKVRYIEAAKSQFNMRIEALLKLAAGVDDCFDMDFALRMVDKFRLNKRKKYNALSFGMKTMVTTIISLASNSGIILLDEPVLGFDAVMRAQFYDLLRESFEAHPRIIVVSTHLLDEIATVAEQIIAIDNGKLMFYEDINTIVEKAYKVTGLAADVEEAVRGRNVISRETVGKFTIACAFDYRPEYCAAEVSDLSLQELFIQMTGGRTNE